MLAFTRDTAILKHFHHSNATPSKAYQKGFIPIILLSYNMLTKIIRRHFNVNPIVLPKK